jgi:hypothetical protein
MTVKEIRPRDKAYDIIQICPECEFETFYMLIDENDNWIGIRCGNEDCEWRDEWTDETILELD